MKDLSRAISFHFFDAEGKSLIALNSKRKTEELENEHKTKYKISSAMNISNTECDIAYAQAVCIPSHLYCLKHLCVLIS